MNNSGAYVKVQQAMDADMLLEIEMYLNDKVALQVFQKFGVLLRVHL